MIIGERESERACERRIVETKITKIPMMSAKKWSVEEFGFTPDTEINTGR